MELPSNCNLQERKRYNWLLLIESPFAFGVPLNISREGEGGREGEGDNAIYLHYSYPCTCILDYSGIIIGGSVGGVFGPILLIIIVLIILYKSRTRVNKVTLQNRQGASEEVSD